MGAVSWQPTEAGRRPRACDDRVCLQTSEGRTIGLTCLQTSKGLTIGLCLQTSTGRTIARACEHQSGQSKGLKGALWARGSQEGRRGIWRVAEGRNRRCRTPTPGRVAMRLLLAPSPRGAKGGGEAGEGTGVVVRMMIVMMMMMVRMMVVVVVVVRMMMMRSTGRGVREERQVAVSREVRKGHLPLSRRCLMARSTGRGGREGRSRMGWCSRSPRQAPKSSASITSKPLPGLCLLPLFASHCSSQKCAPSSPPPTPRCDHIETASWSVCSWYASILGDA